MQVHAPAEGKNKIAKRLELALLLVVPAFLIAYYFATHPFKECLASRSIDLTKYSSSQRLNFLTAGKALDGAVIKQHSIFSFNGRVGRRLAERGFAPAPGYLAGQKQSTIGGGICLVSSTLYQVALLSGLEIVERTPHTETVSSVAPGLDATVWYGRADLKIRNDFDVPVALSCQEDGDQLTVSIMGDAGTKLAASAKDRSIRRREIAGNGPDRSLLVEVYLKEGPGEHLVSRDRYIRSH